MPQLRVWRRASPSCTMPSVCGARRGYRYRPSVLPLAHYPIRCGLCKMGSARFWLFRFLLALVKWLPPGSSGARFPGRQAPGARVAWRVGGYLRGWVAISVPTRSVLVRCCVLLIMHPISQQAPSSFPHPHRRRRPRRGAQLALPAPSPPPRRHPPRRRRRRIRLRPRGVLKLPPPSLCSPRTCTGRPRCGGAAARFPQRRPPPVILEHHSFLRHPDECLAQELGPRSSSCKHDPGAGRARAPLPRPHPEVARHEKFQDAILSLSMNTTGCAPVRGGAGEGREQAVASV